MRKIKLPTWKWGRNSSTQLKSRHAPRKYADGVRTGYEVGLAKGRELGFDAGYSEGYNVGRAKALQEFKGAALQALNKNGE